MAAYAFDEQAKRRYVAVMKKRPHRMAAAEEIGFSWMTVKKHLKNDPAFLANVEQAEMHVIEQVEGVVLDMALDENLNAAKFFLLNRSPDRWKDQQVLRHEHSGVGGGPIQIAQAVTMGLAAAITNPELRAGVAEMLVDVPSFAELEAQDDLDAQAVDAEIIEDDDG